MKSNEPYNVLFVDQSLGFGGALIVISRLVKCLNKNKFHSYIVGEVDDHIMEYNFDTSIYKRRIVHPLDYNNWKKIVSYTRNIKSKYIKKSFIYSLSFLRGVINISYILRLMILILKENIDILHINNEFNTEAIIAAILTGKKCIVHVHGTVSLGFLQKLLIKRISKIIAISYYIENNLIDNNIPKNKVITLYNPINPNPLIVNDDRIRKLRTLYNLNNGMITFGLFGRIVEWKGQREFILAAINVLKELGNSIAFLVGDISDGDLGYYHEITNIIKNAQMEDRFVITGYISNVDEIYNIMDLVVHTSIEPEPFGLVITEAMTFGLPVIASDVGAPKELIDDGKTGFLVDPFDTVTLTKTILTLLKNDDFRMKIAEAGKKDVYSKYDPYQYARNIEKIYADVFAMS